MSVMTVKNLNTADGTKAIPFTLTQQQASQSFARYVSRNKLNPTEVFEAARKGQVRPVYFPAFVFDCNLQTKMHCECTQCKNGETEISSVYRELKSDFSQLIVLSGKMTEPTLFSLLEPYDLQELKSFDSVSDSKAEIQPAHITAEDAFEEIRPEIEQTAINEIKKSLLEYKSEKTQNLLHSFEAINAVPILLPMWVLEYSYKGQQLRLYMNGQTGKIAGVPPRSTTKIIALLGAGAAVGAAIGQLIWMAVKALW